MKWITAVCVWFVFLDVPRANAFGPRFLLSRPHQQQQQQQRGHHERTRLPYPMRRPKSDQRLTTIHCSNSDDQQQQQRQQRPTPTADIDNHQLVLREFAMPLQADLALYERTVRAECLREGGETATVVRWHISRADEETGQAHVEAVFLAPS